MASGMMDFSALGRHLLFGASIGLGLGVGIGAGVIVARKFVACKVSDGTLVVCMSELTQEIKALRVALSSQRNVRTGEMPVRPVKRVRSVNSLQQEATYVKSEDDSDEEFFEMSDDELLALASVRIPDAGQIETLIQEADGLFSAENIDDNKLKVHKLLEEAMQEFVSSAELTWRYSKSYYDLAIMKGKGGDNETKKTLLYKGLEIAEQAIQLDDHCAEAHKWFAILTGSVVEYESVHNQVKLGFDYKEHIAKAIELNDRDASAYHLLGRWCFEISNMSWWQRKAASAFIAEPPTSSIDEALSNFLKAEKLDPGFWVSNVVWIGKCYHMLNKSEEAKTWLRKALTLKVKSDDDQEAFTEAQQLLTSL